MSSNAEAPLILCSTARLARSLQMVQQNQQIQNGVTQWQAPHVTTLSEWLNTVIESAILLGEIGATSVPTAALNATQEGLLWEQSILHSLQSNAAADLFDTSGLASAAMEANRLLTEWRLKLDLENATEETQQFMQWRDHFQLLCKQTNVLEAVRYEVWQITCLERDAGQLPQKIQLAGFDRIHPNTKRLINLLEKRGVVVSTYPITLDTPKQLTHAVMNDQDAECRAAVAWAHIQLKQNPQNRLAIVVPELEGLRAKLSHCLDDTFHPETAAPAFAEITRCYDFTLGVPLSTLPIISTALDLLRFAWNKQQVMQADIAQLLQCVYWSASEQESDARAKLDARMRQQLPLNLKNHRFMRFLHHACEGEHALVLPALIEDTNQLLRIAQENAHKQGAAVWAETFTALLKATHWQGDRSLSSYEYQAVQSFERVLQQLTSLESLVGKISASEAIKRLTQLCKAQIFQPERKTQAEIQVMGMLEATAEPLDAIWVLGMNDHIWPPIARHNALLPAELQRQVGTPNASSEVQTAFAQAIHQRLICSAHHVTFSSATKDGERQLRISPLMHNIPVLETTPVTIQTLAETLAQTATKNWQWVDDHQAPPVKQGEHVSGGTALLKAQAICPAWAFYQYRLNARKLSEPVNGLDVMERGNLVHAVLAKFWQGRGANDLQDSIPEDLRAELLSISKAILAAFNIERDHAFSETFLALEAERLSKLVFAWLIEVEMLRPQGFTVRECEQEHNIEIEGISIKLIIDRVDTLDDDRLLVMDYKTGRQLDYKNWAEPNITEPQLPIYAAFLLQDGEIGAVCYAKVRTADHAFIGIAADEAQVQGATVFDGTRGRKIFDETSFPDWQSIITHWKTQITATALSLKSGDAAVRFDNEKQLDFCDVTPLLRLPERQLQFERKNKAADIEGNL
ncbi:MAG: PD-(D/E)XK nuclease family protein [Methylophilaceae bacterium]